MLGFTIPSKLAAAKGIRLFKNNFMEALTHVHPSVPLCLWGPIALVLLWRGIFVHGFGLGEVPVMLLAGLFAWTLIEYSVHRFTFHFKARSRVGKYLVYLFHGIHHDDPNDKTRLVMPPAGAILLMAVFFGGFWLVLPHPWIEPFFGFFIIGYLCYDYTHYGIHFWPMKSRVFAYLKRNHLLHHFQEQDSRFGVSSPLWDFVFGTRGKLATTS